MTSMRTDSIRLLPGLLPALVLVAAAAFYSGCQGGGQGGGQGEEGDEGPEAPMALSHTYDSPEALGRAVLDALRRRDRGALESLRVTREEYLELFWPELPERDDTPFDFAWQLNDDHSRTGISQALGEFGGQDFELIELRFTEPPEVYETFTVHFGAELRVRRISDGKEGTLPILSVVAERGGRWKLLNFRED